MSGIVGPRGVGKTTLVLQHIKENHNVSDTLYVSMDDLYFANHSLHETAENFHKDGGKFLGRAICQGVSYLFLTGEVRVLSCPRSKAMVWPLPC